MNLIRVEFDNDIPADIGVTVNRLVKWLVEMSIHMNGDQFIGRGDPIMNGLESDS